MNIYKLKLFLIFILLTSNSIFADDAYYKIWISRIIISIRDNVVSPSINFDPIPITDADVIKFKEVLSSEGFPENLYSIKDNCLLYTNDYNLAKHINHKRSMANSRFDSVFKGTIIINEKEVKYLTYNYKNLDISEAEFNNLLDQYQVTLVDDDKLKEFEDITIEVFQNEYMRNNGLKSEYFDLNENNEFIYHLLDLGFSIGTGCDYPYIITSKFKFYTNEP